MATRPRTPEHFPKMRHRAKARHARRVVNLALEALPKVVVWIQEATTQLIQFFAEAAKAARRMHRMLGMNTIPEIEAAVDKLRAATTPDQFPAALEHAQEFADTFKVPLVTAIAVIRNRITHHGGDFTTPVPYPYPGKVPAE